MTFYFYVSEVEEINMIREIFTQQMVTQEILPGTGEQVDQQKRQKINTEKFINICGLKVISSNACDLLEKYAFPSLLFFLLCGKNVIHLFSGLSKPLYSLYLRAHCKGRILASRYYSFILILFYSELRRAPQVLLNGSPYRPLHMWASLKLDFNSGFLIQLISYYLIHLPIHIFATSLPSCYLRARSEPNPSLNLYST